MDGPFSFVQFPQGAAGIVQINLPGGGQLYRPSGPVQQLHVEQIFQMFDLLRQRGLRNEQQFRGARETLHIRHRNQVADGAREDEIALHSQTL